nr:M20 family metallo-hydrolase [Mammaliicoccus lentus]
MNIKRVLSTLETFNQYGRNDDTGGINRIAFTHQERLSALKFSMLCQQEGMNVYFDFMGNVIARRSGKYNDLPAVVIGSHIDTVIEGGEYDGLLGVVAALEVVRHLNDYNIETDHPIEIVAFTVEESTRFNQATLGSKYFCGFLTKSQMEQIKDNNDETLLNVVQSLKQDVSTTVVPRKNSDMKAFLELHIEQGPILQNKGKDIGIVTHIAAPHRFKLKLKGVTSHSGSTPMPMRKDALTTASEIILNIEKIGNQFHKEGIVTTVGYTKVHPNSMNAIPGDVTLLIDVRGKSIEPRNEVVQKIKTSIEDVTNARGIEYTLEDLGHDSPVTLDHQIAKEIENVAQGLNISYRYMFSGAGHDAMNLAKICPTAMIFVPCRDGISHSPLERTEPQQIEKGIQVLIDTVIEISKS